MAGLLHVRPLLEGPEPEARGHHACCAARSNISGMVEDCATPVPVASGWDFEGAWRRPSGAGREEPGRRSCRAAARRRHLSRGELRLLAPACGAGIGRGRRRVARRGRACGMSAEAGRAGVIGVLLLRRCAGDRRRRVIDGVTLVGRGGLVGSAVGRRASPRRAGLDRLLGGWNGRRAADAIKQASHRHLEGAEPDQTTAGGRPSPRNLEARAGNNPCRPCLVATAHCRRDRPFLRAAGRRRGLRRRGARSAEAQEETGWRGRPGSSADRRMRRGLMREEGRRSRPGGR